MQNPHGPKLSISQLRQIRFPVPDASPSFRSALFLAKKEWRGNEVESRLTLMKVVTAFTVDFGSIEE